ncbi:MAG: AAA-like domain-containing protein [Armatimonadota bacterium]
MQDGVGSKFTVLLLGPFDVRLSSGERLPSLRTHKGQWLLALLTLRSGRPVSREWIAGLLWQDSEDSAALYNLRRCLSDLRTALGTDIWRLQTPTARNIALDLSGAEIDVHQFDAAVAQGSPEALRKAVDLYRGPLMEGCDEEWAGQERAPREESYFMALERLAEHTAATGDFSQAAAYLRRVVSQEPTRETAQRALMSVLSKMGDHAAVVQTYRNLRQYLHAEMNIEPAPETQQLMREIRDQARITIAPSLGGGTVRKPALTEPSATDTPNEAVSGGAPTEPAGGAVPLESRFYIRRTTDDEFSRAILRQDSIVLVKGPRQVGKTSLLSRGLQAARNAGRRVAVLDFQKLAARQYESTEALYLAMAGHLYERLELDTPPSSVWNADAGPNDNFERYLRRHVLRSGGENTQLVWALDEIDLLFQQTYSSEVFALFRSWHNERALDPDGPWGRLTLCISYATEAHLFITDLNQSPFNVGTRLSLDDFTPAQVAELAQRHGGLLEQPADCERFLRLVGGHPYLVRRGLNELAGGAHNLTSLETNAAGDASPFNDHLRRLLFLLNRENDLELAVREVLEGRPCPAGAPFYRLRSAGVILGDTPETARLRCGLYARYLESHFR